MRRPAVLVTTGLLALTACSGDDAASTTIATTTTAMSATTATPSDTQSGTESDLVGDTPAEQFPDIVAVDATVDDTGATWSFSVTVSSPYDTPERYADGWRVVGPDGTVYGTHTLLHDHAGEQPFTRVQTGVEIPDGIDEVTIEGRDQANGFGGATVTVNLDELR